MSGQKHIVLAAVTFLASIFSKNRISVLNQVILACLHVHTVSEELYYIRVV